MLSEAVQFDDAAGSQLHATLQRFVAFHVTMVEGLRQQCCCLLDHVSNLTRTGRMKWVAVRWLIALARSSVRASILGRSSQTPHAHNVFFCARFSVVA